MLTFFWKCTITLLWMSSISFLFYFNLFFIEIFINVTDKREVGTCETRFKPRTVMLLNISSRYCFRFLCSIYDLVPSCTRICSSCQCNLSGAIGRLSSMNMAFPGYLHDYFCYFEGVM